MGPAARRVPASAPPDDGQAAATPAERRLADEKPVVKAGEALRPALDRLELQLWQPPEQKGIRPREQVLFDITRSLNSVQSSWDPPSPRSSSC